jgi:hypothetical protein
MARKPTGRPSSYTEDVGFEICERLAHGEPLTRICKSEHMPYVSTVYRWLLKDKTFCDMYARARDDQADTMADQITEIADETPEMEPVLDKEGKIIEMRMHSAYVQWQRNRVDARKWVAAKLKPRKYGDRQILAGDSEAPVEVKHSGMLDEVILNLERKRQLQNESES